MIKNIKYDMRWNGSWYIYVVAVISVSTLECRKKKPAAAIKIIQQKRLD